MLTTRLLIASDTGSSSTKLGPTSARRAAKVLTASGQDSASENLSPASAFSSTSGRHNRSFS